MKISQQSRIEQMLVIARKRGHATVTPDNELTKRSELNRVLRSSDSFHVIFFQLATFSIVHTEIIKHTKLINDCDPLIAVNDHRTIITELSLWLRRHR